MAAWLMGPGVFLFHGKVTPVIAWAWASLALLVPVVAASPRTVLRWWRTRHVRRDYWALHRELTRTARREAELGIWRDENGQPHFRRSF